MAHIVILGAGIGGMPAAFEMREMLPKEHKITVINALDHFQFVPSNPWLAVGWRKRDDVVLQIAPLLERKGIAFIAKPVTEIDAAGSQLTLEGGHKRGLRLPGHHHRSQAQLRRGAGRPARKAATPTRSAPCRMRRPSGPSTRNS